MHAPDSDRLDDLLAAWAGSQRLSDREAEGIVHAVAGPEPARDARWWTELDRHVNAAVLQATQATRFAFQPPGTSAA